MFHRRTAYAAVAMLVALLGLIVAPAPAMAAPTPEIDYAVDVPLDAAVYCYAITGAKVCYELAGDKWWVQDTANDSASAVADWRNYIGGTLYRQGKCINSLGHGKWGLCNKNYYETSGLTVRACVIDYSAGDYTVCSNFVEVQTPVGEA
ncbi:hypothetical protein [Hamadaea tsunoensis]|uniref:hypothetical protein n=1 Tax=Hamadaea tsunoensis TaxID=53368 RepID=UPI0003FC1119|nr:hypothetical protein [Hamadaea tsunoensis]